MDSHEESRRDASERAAEAARKARQYAAGVVDQQKQRAASGLRQLSSSVRETAGRMQDERDHTLAGYAEAAADRLDNLAGYVADQNVNRMLTDAQKFARRRPEIVIGGMFAAGVALARFLKASSDASTTSPAEASDETYVPHSERADRKPGAAAHENDNPYRSFATSVPESPRGVKTGAGDKPNLYSRKTEATGGNFATTDYEPPTVKPDEPRPDPEAL